MNNTIERPARRAVTPPDRTHGVAPAPFVTIELFARISGYSEKAIRRKIERGVWLQGREFVRAPDGHVLISTKGYAQWAAPELA
jgi:hypothetical protein